MPDGSLRTADDSSPFDSGSRFVRRVQLKVGSGGGASGSGSPLNPLYGILDIPKTRPRTRTLETPLQGFPLNQISDSSTIKFKLL